MKLCECGCGQVVNNRFVAGHWLRVVTNPMQIPEIKAKCFTKKHRENMSKAAKGTSNFTGKCHTEKAKIEIGLASTERWKDRTKTSFYGKTHTEKSKTQISKNRKGKYKGKENHFSNADKYSRGEANGMYGKRQSKETIEKILKSRFESQKIRPNKLEESFMSFLNSLFPNEYRYVGDFQMVIGGKCPDFINTNEQKKLIELFGNYWHSEEFVGIPEVESENERINHFKKYGWDCLVVWEDEFKGNNSMVREKLIKFNKEGR